MLLYLKKRLTSFKWAIKGIFDLFKNHPNAQIHLLATIVVLSLSFYLKIAALELCLVLLCIGLVISLEAINSALEYLADKISPEHDELIGKAKDMAAGAVLIAAITTVLIGGIIFLPKIF